MLRRISSQKSNIENEDLDLSCLDTIVDMHSHILPEMDDGSRSIEMTKSMLEEMRNQGVNYVIATPHFYGFREDPESFLRRRNEAILKLKSLENTGIYPNVYVGAEVAYFNGIGHSETCKKLCIEGTNYIMIEMPFAKWNDRVLDEIELLNSTYGLIPIIAHIERYLWQQKRIIVERLFSMEVLIQANSEAFLDKKTMKKAFMLLDGGSIDFLGTDTHNLETRKPNLLDGIKLLASRDYYEALDFMASRSYGVIRTAKRVL